jgi:uncharacterized glyoxalase superfamily protein PhnB
MGSPLDLPAIPFLLHCEVPDVDAHYETALSAGATVLGAPEDQPYGIRTYRAVDPEGHRWIFGSALPGADE